MPDIRPVFANSAWVSSPEALILRSGSWRRRRLRVRYGLFIHPNAGPTLIDTGYTSHSVSASGRSGWLRAYSCLLAPRLVEAEQADRFLGHFGLTPRDISTVIVTHYHADHVSGLATFPQARFIGSGQAWAKILQNRAFSNLRHGVFRELLPDHFSDHLTPIEQIPKRQLPHLPEGHDLFGDGTVLAIPLPGHADGHIGLAFPHLETPLLYATDTQWIKEALPSSSRPRLAPGLISDSFPDVGRSSDIVERFGQAGGHVVLCHDDALSPFDYARGDRL